MVVMEAATLIAVEEYLATDFSPDCDYVDGELQERNAPQVADDEEARHVRGAIGPDFR